MESFKERPLKIIFQRFIQQKSPLQRSHSISQTTHSPQTLYFSFSVKITSTVSIHLNIFVIQRFLHSTLFSSWETREIDVQGE